MQKAGLLAALAVTVVVAVYAYPKADRTMAARVAAIGAERDSSQPTALDKLKAATRSGVNPQDGLVVLPPPRVMDSVKQEIQARPPGLDGLAAGSRPALASDNAFGNAGIDKLAAKLPAALEPAVQKANPIPITALSPASSPAATLVIPKAVSPSGVGVSAPPAAAIAPTASARDDAVPSDARPASPATKPEKTSKVERRRVTQREPSAAPRPAPAQLSRQTSLVRRNEGL